VANDERSREGAASYRTWVSFWDDTVFYGAFHLTKETDVVA